MRDLSERPLLAAALASLVSPILVSAVAFFGEYRYEVGRADAFIRTVLLVWFVTYAYMWVVVLPLILLSRRWIVWTWPWLIVLGAVVGALPWLAISFGETIDIAIGQSWPSALESLWRRISRGERLWMLFAVCGAGVAGAYCILQSVILRKFPAERPMP